jgi:hypothetical protein
MPQPANLLNKIYVVQQQTKVLLVTVKTSEGAPANLTGAKLYMTVRDKVGGTVLITKTTDDDISISCAEGGQATITLTTEDTDIATGCYLYDVWVEYPTLPPTRHPVVKHAEMVVEPALTDFTP